VRRAREEATRALQFAHSSSCRTSRPLAFTGSRDPGLRPRACVGGEATLSVRGAIIRTPVAAPAAAGSAATPATAGAAAVSGTVPAVAVATPAVRQTHSYRQVPSPREPSVV